MFERFTEGARQAVVLAQHEARKLGHDHIGTEHLLLGALVAKNAVAAQVLESLAPETVRAEVVRIVGSGDELVSGQIPFTAPAKRSLELALREALGLGHNHIGTEHILLGLARESDGVAARILLEHGADYDTIRIEVQRLLSEAEATGRRPRELDRPPAAERPTGDPLAGWRRRPVALAALGAAWLTRRAFEPRTAGDLDPIALQVLVAVALTRQWDEGANHPGGELDSLQQTAGCSDDELDDAIDVLLGRGFVRMIGAHDPDPDTDERWLTITDAGAAHVESWLRRVAPLFTAWPPDHLDADDAH